MTAALPAVSDLAELDWAPELPCDARDKRRVRLWFGGVTVCPGVARWVLWRAMPTACGVMPDHGSFLFCDTHKAVAVAGPVRCLLCGDGDVPLAHWLDRVEPLRGCA